MPLRGGILDVDSFAESVTATLNQLEMQFDRD